MKTAQLYEKKGNLAICNLCCHNCHLKPEQTGICNVRYFDGHELISQNYGKLIAENIDPIEKKPLYHYLPGSYTYSIAALGCNMRCANCQNWELSQGSKDLPQIMGRYVSPEEVIESALAAGCESISYTYSEPTIFYEYALEVMKLARMNGLDNIWVSNGYMSKQCRKNILPYLDAINIDLKFFDDNLYRKITGASLKPVLDNITFFNQSAIHLELTTLFIPGYTDKNDQFSKMINFIKKTNPYLPWHISKFYPDVSLSMPDVPETEVDELINVYKLAKKAGLKNVYIGNINEIRYNTTYCHNCDNSVIKRTYYKVNNLIKNNSCPECGATIKIKL